MARQESVTVHNNNPTKYPTTTTRHDSKGPLWMLFSLLLVVSWTSTVSAFVVPRSSSSGGSTTGSRQSLVRLYESSSPVQLAEQEYLQRSSSALDDSSTASSPRPEIVYILLYNPGTAEEGVHTTTLEEEGQEILWAFQAIEDCMHFASLLLKEPPPEFNMALYPEPVPTPAPLSKMEAASRDMGLMLRIVPASS